MKSIYWKELPGNKYLKKPEPFMLAGDGYLVKQAIRPIGRGKVGEAEWYEVKYDKDYVLNKLAIDLLHSFRFRLLSQFLNLMIDVWEKWITTQEVNLNTWSEVGRIKTLLNKPLEALEVDLSTLKTRRLHGRKAYYADELEEGLARQGYIVKGINDESVE